MAGGGAHHDVGGFEQQPRLLGGVGHHLGNGVGIGAGFEQQHPAGGVLRQAGGGSAASGAAADDDHVVVDGHEFSYGSDWSCWRRRLPKSASSRLAVALRTMSPRMARRPLISTLAL